MYKIIQYASYRPINGIIGAVASIAGTAASVAGGMAQAEGLEDQAAAMGQAMESFKQGTTFNYRISQINEKRIKKAADIQKRVIKNESVRQNLVFQENRRRAVIQARTFRESQRASMSDSGLMQGTGSMLDIEADTAATIAQTLGDMSYENTLAQTQSKYAIKAVQSQSVFERMNLRIERRANLISSEGQLYQMAGQQQGMLAAAQAQKISAFGSALGGISSFASGFKNNVSTATPNSFLN
jgi:hypothetical protein